ncbi:MAG TPA: TonB-dependent receptor [Steroidobacteraceae bacterium]
MRFRPLIQATIAIGALSHMAATLGADRLEEIVVTARRHATTLQDTPLSVTALTSDRLRRSAASDITEWFASAPGLSYSDDGWGGHRTTFRGITSAAGVEPRPLSAWYLDDVPMITFAGSSQLGQLGAPHPQAVDLERIEVLRGPQGTLFGSNALGGAVRQITHAPELDKFYGWVDAGVSTTAHGGDNHQLSAVLNVPIVEEAALRLVGYRYEYGGYIDNEARGIADIDNSDTTGGRVAVRWQPTTDLTLGIRALGQKRTARGLSSTDVVAGSYRQRRYAPERDIESWELFNFTLDYDLPWAHLASSTAYVDRQPILTFDITSGTAPFVGFTIPTGNDYNDGVRDLVQELRLVSAAEGKLAWVAGAYYETQDRATHQNWLSPGFDAATGGLAASFGYPDSPWHADYFSHFRQRALYGEVAYALAAAWRATISGRWFDFSDHLDDDFAGLLASGATNAHADYRENGVTPRFALEYRPGEHTLIFVSAAEGFRPGGVNEFTADVLQSCQQDLDALGLAFAPGFASDTLWNYEIGARVRTLDGRLGGSVSAYHIDWRDMQTLLLLPSCGAGLTENAGRASNNGVEVELSWLAPGSLELMVSASYVDARLEEDVPNLAGEANQRIPTVPDWTVSGSARRGFHLSAGLAGFVQADFQYVGGAWNTYDATTRKWVASRELFNLRAGGQRGRWEVELYAENVFDERGVLYHNLNFLGEWQTLVRPRTLGMRARVGF